MSSLIKKTIISLAFFFLFNNSFAQNISYSEFFRLTKIERLSEIEKFLSSKNFKYAGSINRDDHRTVTWTYNCPDLIYYDSGVNFSHGKNYSMFYIQEYKDNYRIYTYVFPTNEAYNRFLKIAKNNHFIFHEDGLNDNNEIYETYIRNRKNRIEYLTFRKNTDGVAAVAYEP